jgi:hypothetical protein
MVVHACSPSYLEGGGQDSQGSMLAWAKIYGDPHLNP